jgi:hypothetical protein
MPKVRRNDPCPCGSGRKYKNCCMRQDRISESRELNMRGDEAALLNAIVGFAQSPDFAQDAVEAFHLYWGGVYDLDGISGIDADDLRRMLEWFIHDHRVRENGQYIIDLFAEKQAPDLPPEANEILEAWRGSSMGLFRVMGREEDSLRLFDAVREVELEAEDRMLSRNAQQGDLLIGRLFELRGVNRLSLMTLILPAEFEEGLVTFVANAYDLYKAEHPQATEDEFLRENGHLYAAYLLSWRAEAFRSMIGPGTRFHDPSIARDKLREFTRHRCIERPRASSFPERLPRSRPNRSARRRRRPRAQRSSFRDEAPDAVWAPRGKSRPGPDSPGRFCPTSWRPHNIAEVGFD